jgi:uncharacterized delta-60 repeat protein
MHMRRRAIRAATSTFAVLLSACALFPSLAGAVAGQPDPAFGNNGFALLDEPSFTEDALDDVLVLPDGKILGGGARGGASGFLLARLTANGQPDLSFGPDGFRVEPDLNAEGSPRGIRAMEARADGKIVVAGLGRGPGGVNAFQFGRYLSNGQLDPGFGTGGMTTVPIIPAGQALGMDQAPDGKLVATGNNGGGGKAVVVRVTEDGEPDSTFNAAPNGVRFVDVPGSVSEDGLAVQVLGDGTVLVGGFANNGAFLAELDASGNPVMGFGTSGIAVHDTGTDAEPSGEIYDLRVLPDGRILAVGAALAGPSDEESFVARFTPSGELDPTFANGGIFHANPTPEDDETESLEILPDGRILVAGLRGEPDLHQVGDTWLYRLTADGQRDPTFGSGGEAFASAVPGPEGAFGLALQPDGKAVVAGDAEEPAGSKIMVGRFLADATPEPISAPKVRRCAGRKATIVGSGKADRVKGTKRADVIVTLGGSDRIDAKGGNDLICAGAGKDVVKGGKGRDRILGEAGKDRILGEAGKDRMVGGPGKDLCNGGPGKDVAAGSCERLKRAP